MNATALRRTADWRDVTRVAAVLAVSVATLWTAPALAQAPAWPTDAKPQQQGAGGPAWPTDNAPQQARPTGVTPGGGFGPPQQQQGGFGPPQPGGFGPPQSSRPMGAPPNQAAIESCNNEFGRWRGEADKKGAVARSISEKHGSPDEFCKAITGLHTVMVGWWKYAKSQVSTCGIPAQVVKQLNDQQIQLAKVRTQACNPAAAGAPAAQAPSLSEALGAAPAPTQNNTTVKRGGTLDTLTGNPIR